MTDTDDELGADPRALPRLLAETIDVEERLRAVKAAAAESHRRPGATPTRDQMLVASAGAVAALVVYLRWRSRRPPRAVAAHGGARRAARASLLGRRHR
jgi:hypothetical protein